MTPERKTNDHCRCVLLSEFKGNGCQAFLVVYNGQARCEFETRANYVTKAAPMGNRWAVDAFEEK